MTSFSTPRTVLVTGSAKRLGRSIAIALAQTGWRVAVHYRHSKQEAMDTAEACANFTSGSAIFEADLNDEHETRGLISSVIGSMGHLDAVVNNASTFELDVAEDFSYEKLMRHMLGNVGAPVVLAQALRDHVQKRSMRGVVLNLLDQKLWNINPDFLSYSLSKAALQMASSMLAQSLAPDVRVCAIAPGLTFPSYLQNDEDFKRTAKYSLTGEISYPEDIAKAAVFMLETTSVSGATLLVDAGQHLTAMDRDVSFL
jgi:NAD(P)-dependent dehydrogenase (short-subunit alcohol dehydrogenase family)